MVAGGLFEPRNAAELGGLWGLGISSCNVFLQEYKLLFEGAGSNPGDKTLEDRFFEHEVSEPRDVSWSVCTCAICKAQGSSRLICCPVSSAVDEENLGEGKGCSSEGMRAQHGAWSMFLPRQVRAVWEASLGLLVDICSIDSKTRM